MIGFRFYFTQTKYCRLNLANCHQIDRDMKYLFSVNLRPTSYVYIKCLYVAEDSSQNPYQICDKSYYGMYKEVTQDLSKVPYHNFSKTECSGKYLEVAED